MKVFVGILIGVALCACVARVVAYTRVSRPAATTLSIDRRMTALETVLKDKGYVTAEELRSERRRSGRRR